MKDIPNLPTDAGRMAFWAFFRLGTTHPDDKFKRPVSTGEGVIHEHRNGMKAYDEVMQHAAPLLTNIENVFAMKQDLDLLNPESYGDNNNNAAATVAGALREYGQFALAALWFRHAAACSFGHNRAAAYHAAADKCIELAALK